MEMYLDLNGGHMGCIPKVCMLYLSLGRKNAVRKKEKISSFYAWLSLPLPGCVYCGGDLDSLAFLFNALSFLCCSSLYPFSLAFLLFSSCPLYSFLLLNLGSVPVPLYRSVVPHESLGNETRNAQVLAFGGPLRPQAAGRAFASSLQAVAGASCQSQVLGCDTWSQVVCDEWREASLCGTQGVVKMEQYRLYIANQF